MDATFPSTGRSTPASGANPRVESAIRSLSNAPMIAAAICIAVAGAILWGLDGWTYYSAPLATRGYLPAHRLLRPSGPVGLALGICGVLAMLSTLPYALRKRWRRLARFGSMPRWLEVHIFFGIVGPVLITFHTSFKFNGLVSAAYWLMAVVWASGFVGRYLYNRIPKTMRGVELSRDDVSLRLEDLSVRLAGARALTAAARRELDAFVAATSPAAGGSPGLLDLLLGEFRVRTRLTLLRRQMRRAGVDVELVNAAIDLAAERAWLVRRVAHLERTRRLFELWHVFHRPLVFVLFTIVALHVGIAVYLGYVRFGH